MTMNARLIALAATLTLGAASVAHADAYGENYPVEASTPSTLTRAEVIAELEAARANHTLPVYGESYNQPAIIESSTPSTLTREQVRNEAIAAMHDRFQPIAHGDY